jgi:hypothetical protein
VSAEHSNGLHSRALSAISVEADSLRDKLHRASEALASADEQLHAARRDAYFLRMRTGVLQAFIDDLQLELSQRSSDTVMVAARFFERPRTRHAGTCYNVSTSNQRARVVCRDVDCKWHRSATLPRRAPGSAWFDRNEQIVADH